MGTLVVAAILIGSMRDRMELLIARLYDASRTDPLTRLTNRRGFRELLDLELERARRAEGHVTVVAADVDHFKELNDRCGQAAGRRCAAADRHAAHSCMRALDGIARVGGDEFSLILPDRTPHEAFAIAQGLRDRVREEFAARLSRSPSAAGWPAIRSTAGRPPRWCMRPTRRSCGQEGGGDRAVLHSDEVKGADCRPGTPVMWLASDSWRWCSTLPRRWTCASAAAHDIPRPSGATPR